MPRPSSTSSVQAAAPPIVTANPGAFDTSPGKVQYAGVNVAGFDFGQSICGVQSDTILPPLASVNNGPDGVGQMYHFVHDDKLNAFRLPVTWQWLVNWNYQTNELDPTKFGQYDELVQGCISAGAALCIIDMHNYARWENNMIGQSPNGPSSAQFASIWSQLAARYAHNPQIAFGLMNEPNDDCGNTIDVATWAATLQGAVNGIRSAGATSQYILLPGKHYDHPETYTGPGGVGDGDTGAAILAITDNGSEDKGKLIIDVHQYLDTDASGIPATCVMSGVGDSPITGAGLQSMATWLARNGRRGILSEVGGGNNPECVGLLRQTLGFLNKNSNLFLGYTAWSAGSFDYTYALDLTPVRNGDGSWTDTLMLTQAVQQCFVSPSTCA